MSPIGSLKKCLFRKGKIEMKCHVSDTISIRSDFQGEGTALHADHTLVGMCLLGERGRGEGSSRTGNSSVENSSLGDLSWVGGSV